MNWKLNPRTGQMEPHTNPQRDIANSLVPIPIKDKLNDWLGILNVKPNVKIVYRTNQYLAIAFNGKWRLLGIITNMNAIQRHLQGPLVNFHDAWLNGIPIDEPKLKSN